MKKSKFSRRITWRVVMIMTVFNIFIFGAIFFFDLILSVVQGNLRSHHLVDGIEGKFETMMEVVKTTAINNRVEVEDNLGSPKSVIDAIERELQVNNRMVGSFAAFEPSYFKSQGKWFEPRAIYIDSTHVTHKEISSKHDYTNSVWYQKAMSLERSDDGYLTDPYYDKSIGSSIYCNYVLPLFDQSGRKVGVFGIVLNLDTFIKSISDDEMKVKEREGVENDPDDPTDDENAFFIQILDSKGTKIAGSESFDKKTLDTIMKKDSIDFKEMKVDGIAYFVTSKRIGKTGWTLVVAQHRDFILIYGYALGLLVVFFMVIGCIVIFFFINRSIKKLTKPLGFLSESAQKVAMGNFDTSLPTFKYQDEIANLRDSFDTMQQSLKRYVEELKESTAAKASMESELKVAHNIQMSMLPKTFPAFPDRHDIDLYASQTPAKSVGGDLYDFFILDEKLFFCVGDVSGKGVPASLVMAVSRTLFRNISAHTDVPKSIVEVMNQNICEGNDNCMFVTLFVGVLDLHTGHLRYCNAGHDAPYLQATLLPCIPNLPIGIMADFLYTEQETQMSPGATLFLFTDGLTEAENSSLELFGTPRVEEILNGFEGSPQQLIETMTTAVHQYVGDTEQSDDLTMLALTFFGNPEA